MDILDLSSVEGFNLIVFAAAVFIASIAVLVAVNWVKFLQGIKTFFNYLATVLLIISVATIVLIVSFNIHLALFIVILALLVFSVIAGVVLFIQRNRK